MKRRNPESAYEWAADVRAYTDRIEHGPVQEHNLAGQQHINEHAKAVERALRDLGRVLPGGAVNRVYDGVTAPVYTFLHMISVPRALWAEPAKPRILKLRRP